MYLSKSKFRTPDKSGYLKKYLSYFSTKTSVVGTQKNRHDETFLMFQLVCKKIIKILRLKNPNLGL